MVNAVVGGIMMSNNHEASYEVFEKLASNNYQWPLER